jgi:hypothetical protein
MNSGQAEWRRRSAKIAAMTAAVVLAAAAPLRAGALLTGHSQTYAGPVRDTGEHLELQVAYGKVSWSKDALLWWTDKPEVATLLAAAREARAAGQPRRFVVEFLKASIQREPATGAQARRLLQQIEREMREDVMDKVVASGALPVLNLALPRVQPAAGHATISVDTEQSEFLGFIDYGGVALINGIPVRNRILVPIFGTRAIHSTIIVQVP